MIQTKTLKEALKDPGVIEVVEGLVFPSLLGNTYIKTIRIGGNFCVKLSLSASSFTRIVGTRTSSALANEITIVSEKDRKVIYAREDPHARIDENGAIYIAFAGNLDKDGGSWNNAILMSDIPISVELIPTEKKSMVLAYDILPVIFIRNEINH